MIKKDFISEKLEQSISIKKRLISLSNTINKVCEVIISSINSGGKVLLFGNGGSASDAQHIAAELSGQFYNKSRPGIAALSLTTNTSNLTAISNDFDFGSVFSRQLEGLLKREDIVIGFSTSGNSKNVINGIEEAKRVGATTVAFTGRGGKLGKLVDFNLSVDSNDTPRIQECHIFLGHLICEIVESQLFDE